MIYLCPIAFLLHVNDIHHCSNKVRFYLFVDDTNILYADKYLKSLENTVKIELPLPSANGKHPTS